MPIYYGDNEIGTINKDTYKLFNWTYPYVVNHVYYGNNHVYGGPVYSVSSAGTLPAARMYGSAVYSHYDNCIYYLGGGSDNTTPVNTIYKYNPSTKTTTTVNVTLSKNLAGAIALENPTNNHIIIFGGNTASNVIGYSQQIYEFDPSTLSMTQLSQTLGHNWCAFKSGYVYGNSNYFLLYGGKTATTTSGAGTRDKKWYYNAMNSGGTNSNVLPEDGPLAMAAYASADKQYMYTFGGWVSSSTLTSNAIIKCKDNTATTLTTTLPKSLRSSCAAALGSNIFVFGGTDGTNNSNSIYKFDTTNDTISTLSVTLPTGIYGASAVSNGTDTIYILGGQDSNGVRNSVLTFKITP